MITEQIIILTLICCGANSFVHRNQSFEIHGRFLCGDQPVHRAAVELWDDNRPLWKLLWYTYLKKRGPGDTYLARTNTDEHGDFIVKGTYRRQTEVAPYLIVYHRCDVSYIPISKVRPQYKLWRRFVLKIPEHYVNTGNRALRVFDLGVYNLQFLFADEILLENCNKRNELYYKSCSYRMPSPFLFRLTHYEFFIH